MMERAKLTAQTGVEDITGNLMEVIKGVHYKTKKSFSDSSDLKDPDIVHLLILAYSDIITSREKWKDTDYKTIMQRRKNDRLGYPINHNLNWTTEDLQELDRLFQKGTDIITLSELLGRTTGSIIARLRLIELITDDEASHLREAII